MIKQLFIACLVSSITFMDGFSQCTSCVVDVSGSYPNDTLYVEPFPEGTKYQPYEASISLRFPHTSTPLTAINPSIPAGLSIQAFSVNSISGLPVGFNWVGDRPLPMVYNESDPTPRDGCITICGTPIQEGVYNVTFNMMISTGVIAPFPFDYTVHLIINDTLENGFDLDVNAGCAPLDVTITNNLALIDQEVLTHDWDFGNGNQSTSPNPGTITYSSAGVYTISDTAIRAFSVFNTYISSVSVTSVSCTDASNAPDIFLTISNLISGIDTITPTTFDANLPLLFSFGNSIELTPGTIYSIQVQDDDAIFQGLPGPEDCGIISFNSDTSATSFTLSSGGLTMVVQLQIVDNSIFDTIITSKLVTVTDNITASTPALVGATLSSPDTGVNYQWINCADNSPIVGQTNQTFTAVANGSYAVIITDGQCSDTSSCVAITSVGFIELISVEAITVVPNPSQGTFTIHSISEGIVVLVNELGQEIQRVNNNATNNYETTVTGLSNGVYFIINPAVLSPVKLVVNN